MKKLFTSILVFACLTASAQGVDTTFQFVDEDGNIIPDGSEITVKGLLIPEHNDQFIDSGLYVRNTTSEVIGASMGVTITRMDNGQLDCCFPQTCSSLYGTGATETNKGLIEANTDKGIMTEWYPKAYGTCIVTLQVKVYESGLLVPGDYIGDGPSVTINFVYDETSAGIDGIPADKSEVVGVYTTDGHQLDSPTKGVNILKSSDGTTKKLLVK